MIPSWAFPSYAVVLSPLGNDSLYTYISLFSVNSPDAKAILGHSVFCCHYEVFFVDSPSLIWPDEKSAGLAPLRNFFKANAKRAP